MTEKSMRRTNEKFKLIKFFGAGGFAQTCKVDVLPRDLRRGVGRSCGYQDSFE